METTTTPTTTKVYPKKNCEHCTHEFDVKHPAARFCSENCRSRFNEKQKRARQGNEMATQIPGAISDSREDRSGRNGNHLVASVTGLSPQAQYIISHLRGELDDKKDELKTLRQKYETLKKDNGDLKEKINKIELDHKIEAIQNEKPSGLAGIAQSLGTLPPEMMTEVLGMIKQIFAPSQPQLQIGGTDGQLDSAVQKRVMSFAQWFSTLPEEFQQKLYDILLKLAQSPNEVALRQNLTKIQNILKNGVSQNGQIHQNIG